MKFKYYYGIFFIAILCIRPTGRLFAQTLAKDSVANLHDTIAIGYGKQNIKYVTGAISTVFGLELTKSFDPNLGNTLYGRLPGLTVNQSSTGEPGLNMPTFYVRGINTSSAATPLVNGTTSGSATSPLIMVDGFESNFAQLVPEEIESISVLKDASATAIYGFRGANGVILVTTKRGSVGKLLISFATKQGFNQAEYLPKFLGSADYATLYNEALANDGKAPLYSAADIAAYQNGSDPYFHPNVNWYDQVLRKTAPVSEYNITMNGGDNTVKYFVMLNAIGNQGLYKSFGDNDPESANSTYNRYNFRTNLDVNLSKTLSATFLLGGTIEDKTNPYNYNTSGIFNELSLLPPNAFPVFTQDGNYGGTSTYSNPLADVSKTGFYSTNGRNLQTSLGLMQKLDAITPGLSVSAKVSLNSYFTSYSSKSKGYLREAISKDPATGNTITNNTGAFTSLSNAESQSDQYGSTMALGSIDYNHFFGKNDVSVNAVYNYESTTYNINNARQSSPYYHVGGGGRLTEIYDQKYIGEFSFGYQGSEQFQSGKRYGFFPAGSLGWIISNESFLKGNKSINFLKIRGSYGLTGNDNIANYNNNASTRFAYQQYYLNIGSYYFGTGNTTAATLAEGPIGNPNLTWEKETKANIGIDATLFTNFQITADVFKNDRYDILVSPNGIVPTLSGVTLAYLNAGKNTNKGFETSVRYNTAGKSFKYFAEINLFYNKNNIVFNAQAPQLNNYQYTAGTPIGQPFGYVAMGLLTAAQATDPAVAKLVGVPVQAGDIRYQDLNNDGKIDGNDTRAIGNTNLPSWTMGFHTGFSYKRFDLDAMFQAVTGNTVYLSGNYYYAFQNNGQIGPIALDRYTPGTAATATYPRLSTNGNQNNYQYSTFWQRNGEFIKLRSAEVGYTFSDNLIKKVRLGSARLFINGTNIFTLSKLTNSDPETLNGYPPQKTFVIGAKIKLL